MMNKLKQILKNLDKIIEGTYNSIHPTEIVRVVKEKRLTICRENKCGYYDPNGVSPNAVIKGEESCGHCGCVLGIKTACLSCTCPVNLWGKIMSDEEEDKFQSNMNTNEG